MAWRTAGVPNLVVVAPGGRAFFIEVKARGSLSPAQRGIYETLTALGTPPAICRSVDDARSAFHVWGIVTREVEP